MLRTLGVSGKDPHRKLPSFRNSALCALIRLFQLLANQQEGGGALLAPKLRARRRRRGKWRPAETILSASRLRWRLRPVPEEDEQ